MARYISVSVNMDANSMYYFQDLANNRYIVIPELRQNAIKAFNRNRNLRIGYRISSKMWYSRVSTDSITVVRRFPEFEKLKIDMGQPVPISGSTSEPAFDTKPSTSTILVMDDHAECMQFIHSSYSLKPKDLFVSELTWKYLVRNVLRGKNILMEGPSGCGKTMTAVAVSKAFNDDHSFHYFNLGSTQDPRATLIGNTHFKKDEGTYFDESPFVRAIQTPNSIILLDELSRAHPEAWNILMTVLDEKQRYLRLDEKDGSPIIHVAKGVCFIATANVGTEFTSTRVVDRALYDRFTRVEMTALSEDQEYLLLQMTYPKVSKKLLKAVAEIADMTRQEVKQNNSKISTIISTRASLEIAGLLYDGFNLAEAAEVLIYPLYNEAGGEDSERTFVKQIVQKFVSDNNSNDLFNSDSISSSF